MSKTMIKHFRVPGSLRVRLEEAGVHVPAVLRRAGLPQNLFEQTRILVSTEELFALWRAIGEVSKDASIGVRLGTESSIAPQLNECLGLKPTVEAKPLHCPWPALTETSRDEPKPLIFSR
jgi:hypothetical protein